MQIAKRVIKASEHGRTIAITIIFFLPKRLLRTAYKCSYSIGIGRRPKIVRFVAGADNVQALLLATRSAAIQTKFLARKIGIRLPRGALSDMINNNAVSLHARDRSVPSSSGPAPRLAKTAHSGRRGRNG